MNSKNETLIFISLLLIHIVSLILLIDNYSISYNESVLYFSNDSLLSQLTHISTSIIGQSNLGLRLPFILFYMGSVILLYLLLDNYFKGKWDRLITITIFMLLPGINSAAMLVNSSIIVVFVTLLYLYSYKLFNKECYLLLILMLFVDNSFAILFLALFFRSLQKKDNILLVVSLILFGISMSMYGFVIDGRPKGFLLDTFGLYSSIFSPLIFLYYFYSIYRVGIKYDKDMFWYLSATSLGLSLIFSLRQHIALEDFAPFVVIGIPIMVKLFLHSMRIRLKSFRTLHHTIASIGLSLLVINFTIFTFNKYLYLVIPNPKSHFAYKYHIVTDLANQLKQRGIYEVTTNHKLQTRLKFYGIKEGLKRTLTKVDNPLLKDTINIKYHNKVIVSYQINTI